MVSACGIDECFMNGGRPSSLRHDFAKQNFKNLANLANFVKKPFKCRDYFLLQKLTFLARLARFLKFCFACRGDLKGLGGLGRWGG